MATFKDTRAAPVNDREELFKVRMGTGCMPNMCNPPDCMTVKEFLDAGHKLAKGDLVTNLSGYVVTLESDCYDWNTPSSGDANRHVLKAKSLTKGIIMTTYKTYQEAQLAHPECTIWCNTKNQYGLLKTLQYSIHDMHPCDPKDYCMTVKDFLAAGHTFVVGDITLSVEGGIVTLTTQRAETWNKPMSTDDERYVLKAKALETKTRTKVEYVPVEFNSDKERAEAFLEGNLYRYTSGEATGSVEEDTYPLEKLADMFIGVGIFRRIETEMSEKDEFVNEAIECIDDYSSDDPKYFKVWFESMYESGKFKLVK